MLFFYKLPIQLKTLADGRGHVTGDGLLERAAGHGQQDGEGDDTGVGDLDGVDHAEVGDRPLDLGVVDRRQRCLDLLEGGTAHDPRV